MLTNPLSYFLVLMLSLVEVRPQVCVTQKIVTSRYIGTYAKTYRDRHGFGELLTKQIVKYFTKAEVKESKFCCEGYSKEYESNEASLENCKPICKSNCGNGYCKSPDECGCNVGYTKGNDTCVPSCDPGCKHGTCVAPNTCRCDSGYNLVNDTCQPICTKPCDNGTCTYPEKCECLPGYRIAEFDFTDSACKPHCPSGCPLNGYCDAPDKCKCNPGTRFNGKVCNKYWPVCRYPCGSYGTCVFPDHCVCFPGFQSNYLRRQGLEDGPVCEPICNRCEGVDCVVPLNSKKCTTATNDITTTTTIIPFKTTSTYHYFNVIENTTTSTTTTAATATAATVATATTSVTATSTTATTSATATTSGTTTTTTATTATTSGTNTTTAATATISGTTTTTAATATAAAISTTAATATVPYLVSSSSPERVVDNEAHTNVTSGDPIAKSWMQQSGTFIWIPLAVIVTTGLILLLVWRRIPVTVINYFKGKSYNVQGALIRRNVRGSFENLQFIPIES